MNMEWEENYKICVRMNKGIVTVSANREGLISLANHLTCLAKEKPGSHIHLDRYNSLEDGSAELIVEKMN